MQKFCEAIVAGKTGIEAYWEAHPNVAYNTASAAAPRMMKRLDVREEITRLRTLAQEKAGSAVLTLIEKRIFLARIVRAQIALLPEDSDLWQSVNRTKHGDFYRLPDKIEAIVQDSKLAGDGSEALMNDSIMALLTSVRK